MKVPTGIIIIVLFLSPVLLSYNTGPAIVSNENTTLSLSQSWLSGWEFRKSHTIEGSLSAGTNYQVRLTVHYGSGTDSGADVYCDTNCKTDFGDIRITDDDGLTLLDYWTESIVTSDHADFWVEIADNLNTSQIIYVYFGNSEAITASDGSTTFMYFDDFENSNFDAWDSVGSAVSIQSSVVKDGNFAAESPGSGGERYLAQNISKAYNGSFMVHTWINQDSSGDRSGYPVYWAGILANEEVHTGYSVLGHNTDWSHASFSPGPVDWPQNSSFISDTWYRIEVGFDMTNSMQRAWNNRLFMGEIPLKPYDVDANVTAIKNLTTAAGNNAGETMWVDNYYIRKWIPLEPSHSEWGPLEHELPSINSPSDLTYEAGTTNNFVTWSPTSGIPASFEVYLDGSPYEDGTWDGSVISISVDGLNPGTYNLTLQVFDAHDNYVTDTVHVIVEDTTNPIINHPPDMIYNETDTGNTIQWNPTDLYPASYVIMLDNEQLSSGTWNTSVESIQISIDGLSAGSYTYNLTVLDQSGNLAFDLVSVVVHPLPLFGNDLTVYLLMIGGLAVVVIIGGIVCRSKKT